ncbi:multidrug resistance-associated protein 5-like [Pecten maximus]|uniref:multidrug resistance-associated protein 5-like n=1 Tax=Pecten maximus TaxID=6579 RepID=UPI0014591442|nr:multidrug resistance-associated protein 5-like [Pecten maximus]
MSHSHQPIPVNDVGFLSYITIGWLTPLVLDLFKHRKKEIREEDVWTCSELESCDVNTERLEPMWIDEMQTFGPEKCSVLRLWLKFIWIRLLVAFAARCFKACIAFLFTGYIVRAVTQYLEGPESSISYVIGLIILTVVGQFLRTCSHTYILVYGAQTGK